MNTLTVISALAWGALLGAGASSVALQYERTKHDARGTGLSILGYVLASLLFPMVAHIFLVQEMAPTFVGRLIRMAEPGILSLVGMVLVVGPVAIISAVRKKRKEA